MVAKTLNYIFFLSIIFIIFLLANWYVASWEPIVILKSSPAVIDYKTGTYIEVRWHVERTNLCQSWNQPTIIKLEKNGIVESLNSMPMLQYNDVTDFVRRYKISISLESGRYVFRHELSSKCNLFFTNRQIIDIPFSIPLTP